MKQFAGLRNVCDKNLGENTKKLESHMAALYEKQAEIYVG